MSTVLRFPYLRVMVAGDETDIVAEKLWALGALGIEERDAETLDAASGAGTLLIAHYKDETAAKAALHELSGAYEVELDEIVGDEWRDAWKRYFKTQIFGRRLSVRPPWEARVSDEARHDIVMDPGRAFGSGMHASTRLLLEFLDEHIYGGESILDVGCGSGILAIAALKLGASHAFGTDIDPDALRIAAENAFANDVAGKFRAWTDDLSDLAKFDVVLANIQLAVHEQLAKALLERLQTGSVLMLSGLLVSQEHEARAIFSELTLQDRAEEGEWLALVYER
ncbi:MAG: 50S ribosomal protein L11 methyltransferase [Myxococcales bacterium]|nr:MAG: 50S ribosomal protein L11 methyltransferase [Myxococcales bacterium]